MTFSPVQVSGKDPLRLCEVVEEDEFECCTLSPVRGS